MKNNIRFISFDLDDTLWDNAPVIQTAKIKLYKKIIEIYPLVSKSITYEMYEKKGNDLYQNKKFQCDWFLLRRAHIIDLLTQSGYDPEIESENIEYLANYYYFWRNRVVLFPDVEKILCQLASHYQLISITNGNANVNEIGIGQFFQFSINAAQVGEKKPSPKLYQQAIKQTQMLPHQICHIGNHFEEDIVAALNTGMQAIWFNPEGKKMPEINDHREIKSIKNLTELLTIF